MTESFLASQFPVYLSALATQIGQRNTCTTFQHHHHHNQALVKNIQAVYQAPHLFWSFNPATHNGQTCGKGKNHFGHFWFCDEWDWRFLGKSWCNCLRQYKVLKWQHKLWRIFLGKSLCDYLRQYQALKWQHKLWWIFLGKSLCHYLRQYKVLKWFWVSTTLILHGPSRL